LETAENGEPLNRYKITFIPKTPAAPAGEPALTPWEALLAQARINYNDAILITLPVKAEAWMESDGKQAEDWPPGALAGRLAQWEYNRMYASSKMIPFLFFKADTAAVMKTEDAAENIEDYSNRAAKILTRAGKAKEAFDLGYAQTDFNQNGVGENTLDTGPETYILKDKYLSATSVIYAKYPNLVMDENLALTINNTPASSLQLSYGDVYWHRLNIANKGGASAAKSGDLQRSEIIVHEWLAPISTLLDSGASDTPIEDQLIIAYKNPLNPDETIYLSREEAAAAGWTINIYANDTANFEKHYARIGIITPANFQSVDTQRAAGDLRYEEEFTLLLKMRVTDTPSGKIIYDGISGKPVPEYWSSVSNHTYVTVRNLESNIEIGPKHLNNNDRQPYVPIGYTAQVTEAANILDPGSDYDRDAGSSGDGDGDGRLASGDNSADDGERFMYDHNELFIKKPWGMVREDSGKRHYRYESLAIDLPTYGGKEEISMHIDQVNLEGAYAPELILAVSSLANLPYEVKHDPAEDEYWKTPLLYVTTGVWELPLGSNYEDYSIYTYYSKLNEDFDELEDHREDGGWTLLTSELYPDGAVPLRDNARLNIPAQEQEYVTRVIYVLRSATPEILTVPSGIRLAVDADGDNLDGNGVDNKEAHDAAGKVPSVLAPLFDSSVYQNSPKLVFRGKVSAELAPIVSGSVGLWTRYNHHDLVMASKYAASIRITPSQPTLDLQIDTRYLRRDNVANKYIWSSFLSVNSSITKSLLYTVTLTNVSDREYDLGPDVFDDILLDPTVAVELPDIVILNRDLFEYVPIDAVDAYAPQLKAGYSNTVGDLRVADNDGDGKILNGSQALPESGSSWEERALVNESELWKWTWWYTDRGGEGDNNNELHDPAETAPTLDRYGKPVEGGIDGLLGKDRAEDSESELEIWPGLPQTPEDPRFEVVPGNPAHNQSVLWRFKGTLWPGDSITICYVASTEATVADNVYGDTTRTYAYSYNAPGTSLPYSVPSEYLKKSSTWGRDARDNNVNRKYNEVYVSNNSQPLTFITFNDYLKHKWVYSDMDSVVGSAAPAASPVSEGGWYRFKTTVTNPQDVGKAYVYPVILDILPYKDDANVTGTAQWENNSITGYNAVERDSKWRGFLRLDSFVLREEVKGVLSAPIPSNGYYLWVGPIRTEGDGSLTLLEGESALPALNARSEAAFYSALASDAENGVETALRAQNLVPIGEVLALRAAGNEELYQRLARGIQMFYAQMKDRGYELDGSSQLVITFTMDAPLNVPVVYSSANRGDSASWNSFASWYAAGGLSRPPAESNAAGVYVFARSGRAFLGDYVWFDIDMNGIQDESENGVDAGGNGRTLPQTWHDNNGDGVISDHGGPDDVGINGVLVELLSTKDNNGEPLLADRDGNTLIQKDATYYVYDASQADGIARNDIGGFILGGEPARYTTTSDFKNRKGFYILSDLTPGEYRLRYTLPGEYSNYAISTQEIHGGAVAVEQKVKDGRTVIVSEEFTLEAWDPAMADDAQFVDYDLGITLPYRLGGLAWLDVNNKSGGAALTRNGYMNDLYKPSGSGELLLAGIEVTLRNKDGSVAKNIFGEDLVTVTSAVSSGDKYGKFFFDYVLPGDYYAEAASANPLYSSPTIVPTTLGVLANNNDNDLRFFTEGVNITAGFNLAIPTVKPEPAELEGDPVMRKISDGIGLGYFYSDVGELSGCVWDDSSGVIDDDKRDGYRDAGQNVFAGIPVELHRFVKDDEGKWIIDDTFAKLETVTDAEGKYLFDNLIVAYKDAGDDWQLYGYKARIPLAGWPIDYAATLSLNRADKAGLTEALKPYRDSDLRSDGWLMGDEAVSVGLIMEGLTPGKQITGYDAGFVTLALGSLAGVAWVDADNDGIRGEDERHIYNQKVYLEVSADGGLNWQAVKVDEDELLDTNPTVIMPGDAAYNDLESVPWYITTAGDGAYKFNDLKSAADKREAPALDEARAPYLYRVTAVKKNYMDWTLLHEGEDISVDNDLTPGYDEAVEKDKLAQADYAMDYADLSAEEKELIDKQWNSDDRHNEGIAAGREGGYILAPLIDPRGEAYDAYDYYSGLNVENNDLGLLAPPPNYLSGIVWNDLNEDGYQDKGENLLEGRTVKLYRYNYTELEWQPEYDLSGKAQVTTGADGSYQFVLYAVDYENAAQPPIPYRVVFEKPVKDTFSPYTAKISSGSKKDEDNDAWRIQDMSAGDIDLAVGTEVNYYTRAVTDSILLGAFSGELFKAADAAHIDCGVYAPPPAIISGVIWEDLNKDGRRDEEESLIANIPVTLYIQDKDDNSWSVALDGEGNEFTVLTDDHGAYAFTVDAADYGIEVDEITGAVITTSSHIFEPNSYRVMAEKDLGYAFAPYKVTAAGDALDSDILSGEQLAAREAYDVSLDPSEYFSALYSAGFDGASQTGERVRGNLKYPDYAVSYQNQIMLDTSVDGGLIYDAYLDKDVIDYHKIVAERKIDGGLIPILSVIRGIVWDDSYARDDIYGVADKPFAGAEVRLYASDQDVLGESWHNIADHGGRDAVITAENGLYEFTVFAVNRDKSSPRYGEAAEYRVVFAKVLTDSYVKDNVGADPAINSHAVKFSDLDDALKQAGVFTPVLVNQRHAAAELLSGAVLTVNGFYQMELAAGIIHEHINAGIWREIGGGGDLDPEIPEEPEIPEIPEEPEEPEEPQFPEPPDRPGEGDPLPDPIIVYDDDGVPMGEWRMDPETGEWIFYEYPLPQGNLPQTGDNILLALLAFTASIILMSLLTWRRISSRRKS
jgi:hypothetical protein